MSLVYASTRENNFDLLRLVLAIVVAIVHLGYLSQNPILLQVSHFFSAEIAVDAFFVVSGFLIFMSYDASSSVRAYALKRVRRILPGYGAVIIFCALMCYFISGLTAVEYFGIDIVKYLFFNLLTLNFMAPTLPGVFAHNPWQDVNGALWTIKIEVMFYLLVPFVGILLSRANKLVVFAGIYLLSLIYSFVMLWFSSHYGNAELLMQLQKQLPGQLVFFVSGACLYYYYGFFRKYATSLFSLSIALLIIDRYLIDITFIYPIYLSIIIIYISTIFRYLGNFGKFGDFSFGIYIWHFPIIQTVVALNLFENGLIGVALSVFSIFIAAFLSWHCVEKRFLYPSSHYKSAEK